MVLNMAKLINMLILNEKFNMLILNEKFIINIVYFHFSETVFWRIILEDDNNLISSHSYLYEPIFLMKISQYMLVNSLLMKYILVFVWVYFLYYDTLKKLYHNCRHNDFKCMYSETYLIRHALWETFGVGIDRLSKYTV